MNDAILAAIREVAAIPAERRLWSLATIAEYAELSVSHVAQVIAARPDFPKPARPCGRTCTRHRTPSGPARTGRAGPSRAG